MGDELSDLQDMAQAAFSSTKIHGGFFDVFRINVLLGNCNRFSASGDLVMWKRTLDALHREVSPRIDKRKEAPKIEQIVLQKIVPAMRAYMVAKNKRVSKFLPALTDQLYTLLYQYEILLRAILHRIGVNLPKRGATSALMGGD